MSSNADLWRVYTLPLVGYLLVESPMPVVQYTWDPLTDNVLEEKDEIGSVIVTYSNEPIQWGPLLSEQRGGQKRAYQFDAVGATRALVDSTGTVTDTFTYDSWGNEVQRTGLFEVTYRWAGRWGYQYDPITTSHYIRRRSYTSITGRWTACDFLDMGDRNSFRYVYNRPIRVVDPSGLVDFELTPEKPDSMAWYSAKLPKANEVGQTTTKVGTGYKLRTKQCKYKCEYILHGEAKITLDPDKTIELAKVRKGLTLETNYGHEQQHVKNFISIMEWGKSEFEGYETEVYDSKEEAENACKKHLDEVTKKINDKIKLDGTHKSKDPKSPPAGKPVDPIGTMPSTPTEPDEKK